MPTHHARLIFSPSVAALELFVLDCQRESEVTLYKYATVSIADVRNLILTAFLRPTQFNTRTLVVAADGIAPEAQQALLKILEEPPLSTRFVLWLRPGAVLLPTLRSRLFHVIPETVDELETDPSGNPLFTDFLNSTYASRLELITVTTKNKDMDTLASLSLALRGYLVTATNLSSKVRSRILWCLAQLEFRGASKKMLWEEIALTLPVEAKR